MDEEKGVEKGEEKYLWSKFGITIVVFICLFISVNVIVKAIYPEEELVILAWVKRGIWVFFTIHSVVSCDMLLKRESGFKMDHFLYGTSAFLLAYLLFCIFTPLVFWALRRVQEGNEGLNWLWGVIWN